MSRKIAVEYALSCHFQKLPESVNLVVSPNTGERLDANTNELVCELSDLTEMIDVYKDMQLRIEDLKASLEEVRAHIKRNMGPATLGVVGETPVLSWRYRLKESFDAKALKDDFPELYLKYAKTTLVRHFVVK